MNNNNNKERERLIHLSLQGCDYESFELDQVDSLLLLSMEEICQEEEGRKEGRRGNHSKLSISINIFTYRFLIFSSSLLCSSTNFLQKISSS